MSPSGQDLRLRLDAACAQYGDAAAVSDAVETLSYRDFACVAAEFADALGTAGLERDEPVLVALSDRGRELAALYAVWKAGGVAVPSHRNAAAGTLRDMVDRTRARFLLNGCPERSLAGEISNESVIQRLQAAAPPKRDILSGAAWVVFTSGSTGIPKGVVHAHDSYVAKLDAINSLMRLPAPGRVLVPLRLIFVYAHWVTLTTLLRGGEVVLACPFRPESFMDSLAHQPVAAAVVPTMLRTLRPLIESRVDFTYSGALLSGGEPLPAELGRYLRERWPRADLWDIYGLTETATSDFYVCPKQYDRAAGTIGAPAPGVGFRIAENTGELQIRTPYLMRGYLDAPKLTADALSEGYFRTGDQARETEDGFVAITGRLKDLVNRAGNKISPIEIETAFLEHDGIEQALAAGVPDDLRGESLHIMLVPAGGASLNAAQLREWAARRLERYKVPDVIHLVSSLPVGRTGKADRNAMRAQIVSALEHEGAR